MSKISEALSKARLQRTQHYRTSTENTRSINLSEISSMMEDKEVTQEELSNLKIISPEMERKDILNEFRDLRTTIVKKYPEGNITIQVYSTISEGGSSYIAVNLAAAFAFDELKSSLLVNCNKANKSIYEALLEDDAKCLVDFFAGNADVESIIHPTGIKRLRIIPYGGNAIHSTESFSSRKASNLFRELKSRYNDRYVLIDSPPSSDSADVKLLSSYCDIAILVVPYGKSSVTSILKAANIIGADKLFGVVIDNKPRLFN